MATVLGMLAVAVTVQAVGDSHLLGSISAYYWTPVRPVFVAALMALGVGMLALKPETDLEDVLLDVAGALAPVVAFVPTPLPDDEPLPDDVVASVGNNVVAYLAAGAVALVVYLVARRTIGGDRSGPVRRAGTALLAVGLVGLAAWLALAPGSFRGHAHLGAAFPLFGCVLAVVLVNAMRSGASLPTTPTPPDMRARVCPWLYWLLLVVMVAGILVAVLLTERRLLWAEVAVLGPFLVFWLVQTVELWEPTPGPAHPGRLWPYGRDVLPWRRRRT